MSEHVQHEARWVVGIGLVVTAVAAALVVPSYFFFDDFLFLTLGRESPLDWAYLSRSAFGHFIPGFMFTNKALAHFTPVPWGLAAALLIGCTVACPVALWRLTRALVGTNWLPLAAMGVMGTSVLLLNTSLWWAGGLCLLPSTALNLAAMAAAVNWDEHRRRRDLVLVGVSYLGAMVFWEKSLLVAVYTTVLLVVVVDAGTPIRSRVGTALRRWPLFLVFAVIGAAYAGLYVTGDYVTESAGSPSPAQMGQFLSLSAFEGLFPGLFGIRYPHVTVLGQVWLGWVLPAALVLGLVVWTSLRAAKARAAWVFFVLVYLANQVVLGYGRIGYGGIHIGREYRYQLDNLVFFLTAAVVALHAALGARRAAPARRHRPAEPAARRRVPVAGLVLGALALAVFVPAWLRSAERIQEESPADDTLAYLEAFDDSLAAARAAGDDRPVLPSIVPEWIVTDGFYPFNRQDFVLPVVRGDVPFATDTSDGLVLDLVGNVRPAEFQPRASREFDEPVCVAPGEHAVAVSLDTGGLERTTWFVQVRFTGDVTGVANITVGTATGERDFINSGRTLTVAGDELFASGATTDVTSLGVLIDAEPGACVRSLAIGGVL